MTGPGKAEVRLSDQRLLVADSGNDRVQVFAPLPGGGSPEAPLADASVDGPRDVAIDQDTGEVYVADTDGIVRFSAAGTLDATFAPLAVTGPIDFDESTDELVVGDTATATVRRYSRAGLPGATFDGTNGSTALATILDLTVDSTGDVLVVDSTGSLPLLAFGFATSTVERYGAAGAYEAAVGPVATPTTVAVEPSTDRVVVGGNINGSRSGQPLRVSSFTAAGAETDTVDLPADGSLSASSPAAVAIGEVGGRMYAVTDIDVLASDQGTVSVQAYDNLASPTFTDPVVSDIGGEQVDVSASVDPNGNATAWVVEHSADGGTSWTVGASGTTGAGDDPVPVAVTVDGLQPRSSYIVRIRATLSGVRSAAVPFQTAAVPPKVLMTDPAAKVTTGGARLLGLVDPQASATGYWFEYGTSTQYGGRVPATAVPVGDGNAWMAVAQNLSGLQADTTYHYRLVAENAEGVTRSDSRTFTTSLPAPVADSCPNADVRRQQGSSRLADCRAYEMVTPTHKSSGGVSQGFRAADDGSAVGYMMNSPVGPDVGAPAVIPSASRRTGEGWTTAGSSPPIRAERRNNGEVNSFAVDYSNDFRTAYLDTNDPLDPTDLDPIDAGSLSAGYDVYRFDLFSRQSTWMSRPHPDMAGSYLGGGVDHYMGRSADGRHVVFRTDRPLLPGAPADALYEVADDELRLVSELPDGNPATGITRVAGPAAPFMPANRPHGISADGSRIYWTTGSNARLYLRENGTETIPVSRSRATATAGQIVNARFLDASADGSIVYFGAVTALVDGAPSGGLYRYDRETDTLSFLTQLTGISIVEPDVFYRHVASESGDRLYFKSTAALAPGAVAGSHNLYLWDGELELVAPTSTQAGYERPIADPRLRVTPDGRYAVFSTLDSLGPNHRQGVNEIYLYDADTEELECASCRQDGGSSTEDSYLRPPDLTYAILGDQARNQARNVASDGTVFFQTAEALVPEDSNGVRDVYAYDHGDLKLISSGQGEPSELLDSSEDGSSVFFVTPNSLTARDVDGGYPDVYVARVDGGFPEPDPAPERCSGDGCQGDRAGGLADVEVGSSGQSGAGNVKSPGRVSIAVAGAGPVRGARGVLRVRASAAGRVTVSGTTIRRASKRVSRPATVRVPIRLTASARERLAARGRLRVRVRVVFASREGRTASRVVAVTFKRPVGAGRGGRR